MAKKTLTQFRSDLRADLKDAGTVWSDEELNRCITKAYSDLSRFMPNEAVVEFVTNYSVTDEAWTSAAAAGTYVTLANKPIEHNSETVKNAAGTTMTRNTDYTMDYSNGRITHISTGSIGDAENCTISYNKSRISFDMSDYNVIRIIDIEYPMGEVPQSHLSFSYFNNIITISTGQSGSSQARLAENKNVAIRYQTPHTLPTDTVAGTCPEFLEDTITLAAGGYALLIKAVYYEQAAGIALGASNTQIGLLNNRDAEAEFAAASAAADAAQTSIGTIDPSTADTLLGYSDTILNPATDELGTILTTMKTADIVTLLDALVASGGELYDYDNWADYTSSFNFIDGATAPSMASYLTTGGDHINAINIGAEVASLYQTYSAAVYRIIQVFEEYRKDKISAGEQKINVALAYMEYNRMLLDWADRKFHNAELTTSAASVAKDVDNVIAYTGEQYNTAGRVYNEAGQGYLAAQQLIINASSENRENAKANLEIAEMFRAESIERRNEAWAIWRDPRQYAGNYTAVSTLQPTRLS